MNTISLLVAYSKNRVIGAQGTIPWKLSSERNRFKAICQNKKILMGRKSFEEIGHALPYCTIIIISTSMKDAPQGCLLASSLEEALKIAGDDKYQEILVAGGGQIYEQTLSLAKKIYATEIDIQIDGDVFFPKLGKDWKVVEEEEKKEGQTTYRYLTFVKD